MSHLKRQKPRFLGYMHPVGKLPQLASSSTPKHHPSLKDDAEKLQQGIHGSAMTVTVQSENLKDSFRVSTVGRPKSDESPIQHQKLPSSSSTSHENCKKEIRESLSREKKLKSELELLHRELELLHRELEELKDVICKKEEESKVFKDQLETQQVQFTVHLREEQSNHEAAKTALHETTEKLMKAKERTEKLAQDHKDEIEKLKEAEKKLLIETVAEKDAQITDMEQKLARLKLQMAEALKGNSWERQQQLDELTKELSRVNEECDILRMKIKSMSKNKQDRCSSCEDNNLKISQLQASISEKDATIAELQLLCGKFESQLSIQDNLLQQWALSKGHKIYAPK